MNIKTVYNDFCGRSIKVFVFDFAFRAAVNSVRKVCTEFGNIEIVRTGADLFIGGKADAKFAVGTVFGNDALNCGHDFGNACFVIAAENCCSVGHDERFAL